MINCDRLPACSLIGSPFLPRRHILKALLQQSPVAIELLGSLVEVSPIRRKGGFVVSDNCAAS